MLSSICPRRRCILTCVKFRSRVLTALNLLPSIATLASLNNSRRRHSTTNAREIHAVNSDDFQAGVRQMLDVVLLMHCAPLPQDLHQRVPDLWFR